MYLRAGAVAKISCEAKSTDQYKAAKFSMLTPKSDKNGYFLATFTPEQLGDNLKPTDCKVYLESSPSYTCNVATNVNLGVTGAPLTYSRDFGEYKNTYNLVLYSVPAFVYTSKTKCEKPSYYKTPVYTPKASYKTPTYTPKLDYEVTTYTPPAYTPKSSYKAPTYTPLTYTPKPSYEAPTYTPSTYTPKSSYKAPASYSPSYKTPSYSPPAYTPKSTYKAPSYVPKSEDNTPAYTNYGY